MMMVVAGGNIDLEKQKLVEEGEKRIQEGKDLIRLKEVFIHLYNLILL